MAELFSALPAGGWQRLAVDCLWQSTLIGLAAFVLGRAFGRRPAVGAAIALLGVVLCVGTPLLSAVARYEGWGLLARQTRNVSPDDRVVLSNSGNFISRTEAIGRPPGTPSSAFSAAAFSPRPAPGGSGIAVWLALAWCAASAVLALRLLATRWRSAGYCRTPFPALPRRFRQRWPAQPAACSCRWRSWSSVRLVPLRRWWLGAGRGSCCLSAGAFNRLARRVLPRASPSGPARRLGSADRRVGHRFLPGQPFCLAAAAHLRGQRRGLRRLRRGGWRRSGGTRRAIGRLHPATTSGVCPRHGRQPGPGPTSHPEAALGHAVSASAIRKDIGSRRVDRRRCAGRDDCAGAVSPPIARQWRSICLLGGTNRSNRRLPRCCQ